MKTTTVRARIEPELKLEVEGILSKIGLSFSEAIEVYLRQIKLKKGIPFDLRIPNDETLSAFKDSEEGNELTQYENPEEMFKKLGL